MKIRRGTHATVGEVICPPVALAVPPEQPPLPRGARAATFRTATIADVQQAWGKFKRSRRAHAEHDLQEQVATYLDRALPPDAFWTSIDSAGRGARDGARMKRRGVRKGIFDILIIWNRAVTWIELKSANGRVTTEQREFAIAAERAGMPAWCCRSVDEVEKALLYAGIPLRCRVSA